MVSWSPYMHNTEQKIMWHWQLTYVWEICICKIHWLNTEQGPILVESVYRLYIVYKQVYWLSMLREWCEVSYQLWFRAGQTSHLQTVADERQPCPSPAAHLHHLTAEVAAWQQGCILNPNLSSRWSHIQSVKLNINLIIVKSDPVQAPPKLKGWENAQRKVILWQIPWDVRKITCRPWLSLTSPILSSDCSIPSEGVCSVPSPAMLYVSASRDLTAAGTAMGREGVDSEGLRIAKHLIIEGYLSP